MINEEEILKEKLGNRNPFTVPEGYFDHLADRVMQQLPAERKPAVVRSIMPWLYAVACVAILIMSVLFVSHQSNLPSQQTAVNATTQMETLSDNYIDDMADYAMMDNEDIYLYLADL